MSETSETPEMIESPPGFDWSHTYPFTDPAGANPAVLAMRQISENDFTLLEAFRYYGHAKDEDGRTLYYDVTPARLGPTDLASVPWFLGWFARRHGDHTAAALLHDQLIPDEPAKPPKQAKQNEKKIWRPLLTPPANVAPAPLDPPLPAARADRMFRQALLASHVPPVKAYFMWSAVSLRTRCKSSGRLALLAIIAWFLASAAGTAGLVYGPTHDLPLVTLVSLVGPVLGGVLWGKQWGAGVIAGYAVWLIVVGSIPAALAYYVYWCIEFVVSHIAWLVHPGYRERVVTPKIPSSFANR